MKRFYNCRKGCIQFLCDKLIEMILWISHLMSISQSIHSFSPRQEKAFLFDGK